MYGGAGLLFIVLHEKHDHLRGVELLLQLYAVVLGAPIALSALADHLPAGATARVTAGSVSRSLFRRHRQLRQSATWLFVIGLAAALIADGLHARLDKAYIDAIAWCWIIGALLAMMGWVGAIFPPRYFAPYSTQTPPSVISVPALLRSNKARLVGASIAFALWIASYALQLLDLYGVV